MATKASDQLTVVDITDAYTVMLTSEAYTFIGNTTHALPGSCSTQVIAYLGNDTVLVNVGSIVCPNGITASVTSNGTASPVITFTVAAGQVSTSCEATIPLTVDGKAEFSKKFSFGVALKGTAGTSVGVSGTSVTYQASASGTVTPSGSWVATPPDVPQGQYLWTKTEVTYSDSKKTTSYSVSRQGVNGSPGSNGTSVTVTSNAITYQASTSGTDTPTGAWGESIPSVPQGQYLWTKTAVTYSDGKSTTAYSVSRQGVNGSNGTNGADALVLTVSSSNGVIFKNAAIATVLAAHVYKGGVEVTGASLTALGAIKWYKDGGTTPVATGVSLTISAGDVNNKATYEAKLEG